MHRKGAQDAKRAKKFAKLAREILVSAKSGLPDPNFNPRLRAALAAARGANMPRDNIDRALKKAMGGEDNTNFEEVRYEGYGPGGVAVIVEGLTDNRNRTASEIRSYFTKCGGNLGESGSVGFMFERMGWMTFPSTHSFDQIFEAAVDVGAENVETIDDTHEVTCTMDNFATVRDGLIEKMGDPLEAKIIWRAHNMHACDEQVARTLMKLVDLLEDNDDVQHVYTNADICEEVAQKLSA